jgi:hypothetical protein
MTSPHQEKRDEPNLAPMSHVLLGLLGDINQFVTDWVTPTHVSYAVYHATHRMDEALAYDIEYGGVFTSMELIGIAIKRFLEYLVEPARYANEAVTMTMEFGQ